MHDNGFEEHQKIMDEKMSKVKNKIMVMSGKGGVGKTTVSVNLALSLADKGYNVGIIDVDIHGPNIAKMLGIEDYKIISSDGGIEPVEVLPNLKVVSLANAGHHKDKPFIWRGPIKIGVIKQFIGDVHWGDLDYLIIDSPPGTGDEPLTVREFIKDLTGAIIVTTPQEVAILDSRKCINFAKETDTKVIGVIENMSGYTCPHCGEVVHLFGKDGGKKAAEEMKVPFLGKIPIDPEVVSHGDHGRPYIVSGSKKESRSAMKSIIKKIVSDTK